MIGWNYCTERYNSEYRRVLMELLEPNPRATLLDLGCGNCALTRKVMEKVQPEKAIGIDLYPQAQTDITIYLKNLNEPFPLPSNLVDVVTASQIIEHLDNTDRFIKEIYRVLRPNGYAIISTNNLAALHWIALLILGKQPPTACTSDYIPVASFEPKGVPMHRRLFTADGLTKLLKYYNFQIEKVVGTYYFPFPVPVARALCKLDKRHAHCITVKARKP